MPSSLPKSLSRSTSPGSVNKQTARPLRPSRAVRPEEVEALAAKHRAHLFEASAKQGEGVADIFACIVQQHHAR